MTLNRDWETLSRPAEVKLLEDHLRNLQSRLLDEARDDDPVLQEIERITCWLELFNSLFKGLIEMNRIVTKSASCQEKLAHILKHRISAGASISGGVGEGVAIETLPKSVNGSEKSAFVSAESSPSHSPVVHLNQTTQSSDKSDRFVQEMDSLAARVSAILNRTAFPIPLNRQETSLRPDVNIQIPASRSASSSSSSSRSSATSSSKSSDAAELMIRNSLGTEKRQNVDRRVKNAVSSHTDSYTGEKTGEKRRVRKRRLCSDRCSDTRNGCYCTFASENCENTLRPDASSPFRSTSASLNPIHLSSDRRPNSGHMHKYTTDISREKDIRSDRHASRNSSSFWFVPFDDQAKVLESLQEAFNRKCARMKQRSEKRSSLIRRRAETRKLAHERLFQRINGQQGWIHHLNPCEEKIPRTSSRHQLPVAPFRMKRVFTHREMRIQTERIYRNLPEVKEREKEEHKGVVKQTHEIMKHIFTNKIQQQSLKGRVHFPITQNFICY